MKFVATGDWHFHNWKEFSKIKTVGYTSLTGFTDKQSSGYEVLNINSRLYATIKAVQGMIDYMRKNSITVMLVAGDVFHERGSVDVTVYNAVYRLFKYASDSGITSIIVAGNHDQVTNDTIPENSLLGLSSIKDVKVISKTECVWLKSTCGRIYRVLGVPFSKDKNTVLNSISEFLDNKQEDKAEIKRNTILLTHLGINGAFVGKTNYANADEYSLHDIQNEYFKYAVLGHYHKPQELDKNAVYTGSIIQNNFNDEGDEHGFWVLDMEEDNKEFIPVSSPKFLTATTAEELQNVSNDKTDKYIRVQGTLRSEDVKVVLGEEENVRVETEREYDVVERSKIKLTQSWEEMIKTYAAETEANEGLGLSIFREVFEKGYVD